MRVTLVHSYYSSASVSGENLAFDMQVRALVDEGHDVDLCVRHTDEEVSRPLYGLRSAVRVATGMDPDRRPSIRAESDRHVLHVHNLFPNFGASLVSKWRGPVVATIHNFRTVCSNGLLLRDGKPCTECLDGTPLAAVRHGCYRSSPVATAPLAVATWHPAARNPVLSRAAQVVAQSERAAGVLRSVGVPDGRLSLVTGFTTEPAVALTPDNGSGRWVFVGRLSAEKGLRELLSIWPPDVPLDVVGDGPEMADLIHLSGPAVTFMGALEHSWVDRHLSSYAGLVFPGLCWEGAYPMVVREALAHGVPVVAAMGSSAADLVSGRGGGVTYEMDSGVQLRSALRQVTDGRGRLRREAREVHLREFTEAAWLERMGAVYERAVDIRQRLGPG
jgi:glycosyltransferase involved in cell wall biosynthesis